MLRLALALLLLAPASALARPGDLTPPVPPASPTPFAPDASRFAGYLRFGQLWITDPRFDLVGEDDALSRIEVGGGWTPDLFGGDVTLEAGYAFGRTAAPVFDLGEASLALHSIQASAIYRHPTSARSRAFARGLLSLDFAALEVTGDDGAAELDDVATLLGLEGTLGWELLFPLGRSRTADGRPRRHLAVGAEAGYAVRPFEAEFELARDVDEEVRPARIERAASSLGGMDLSSWVLRLGATLRF